MSRKPRLALPGRTVLITGAGSGIGAACARALAHAGAQVALVDVQSDGLERTAALIGPRALVVPADVTDRDAMERAAGTTIEHFGALDVVFANAGIAGRTPQTVRSVEEAEFEKIVEVDLLGVWRTVRACLPAVTAADGHVLVTSSVYAHVNGMVNAPYAMSKAAVESFGRSLRAELAGTGTTAGVLYPGWVTTPIIEASHTNPLTKELLGLAFPGPYARAVTADRIAAAVVRGIEARSARVICPRRWIPLSVTRGVVSMATDALVDRHRRMQSLVRQIEQQPPVG